MRFVRAMIASVLVFASTIPAQADFKYTETSQVTGGALIGALKFASVFARGDAKKQEREALAPTTSAHYIKGNRLRTDEADGRIQIIDLDGRRVISIDPQAQTYGVATFEQIKAAMEQAQQQMQQQMQQKAQQDPKAAAAMQNTQLTISPTVTVTPGTGNRVILDQPTNENKVKVDMTMQASSTDPVAQSTAASSSQPTSSGQPTTATVTYSMNMDTFVAPSVSGYLEFAEFYRRMAKEVSWMTLPSSVHIDPRVSQGLSQLQQNSDALKGFPLLSYVSMTLAVPPDASQSSTTDQKSPSNPPPSNSSKSSSNSSVIDSPSAAMAKGLGSLFNRKKQQDNSNASGNAPPPNPNADPNALIEITTQVNSFSASSLDGSLFDIPAGYTQIQVDPALVMGGAPSTQARPKK